MDHESIASQINKLKTHANEREMIALNILHNQLHQAGAANWTRQDLDIEVKQNTDAINGMDQDSEFYENARNIQDQIIGFFGE